jgi:hypothetical protein
MVPFIGKPDIKTGRCQPKCYGTAYSPAASDHERSFFCIIRHKNQVPRLSLVAAAWLHPI